MTYGSVVWVSCDLCYRSHGAVVDRDDPKSVEAGKAEAGLAAQNCDHTGGVNQ